MKSIVLLALLAVSAAANADDIQDAALACLSHRNILYGVNDGVHYRYEPRFEACEPLVDKWEAAVEAANSARERERKKREIETINKGLQAAGLPLLSE